MINYVICRILFLPPGEKLSHLGKELRKAHHIPNGSTWTCYLIPTHCHYQMTDDSFNILFYIPLFKIKLTLEALMRWLSNAAFKCILRRRPMVMTTSQWAHCCLERIGTHPSLQSYPTIHLPGSNLLPITLMESGICTEKLKTKKLSPKEWMSGPDISWYQLADKICFFGKFISGPSGKIEPESSG